MAGTRTQIENTETVWIADALSFGLSPFRGTDDTLQDNQVV